MRTQTKDPETKGLERIRSEKDLIDWEELLKTIDFLSLKILDHIYLKDQLTLHKLSRELTRFGVCSATIRNRLADLEDRGLIEVVPDSNPLCLAKKFNLEENVKRLIILGYGKFEVGRDG